ncbi:MAG: hypothetical protein ACLP6G_06680 [Terriglobales bacterium]
MYNPPPSAKPLDLRSPFLKVKWAKDHISKLREIRTAFVQKNIYFGSPKFNIETNRTQFILGDVPSISPDVRLLLGDTAHNLRTALDHLACELARSVGIADPMVYFPIFESRTTYEAVSSRKTHGMPPEAKNLIDRIGPYGGHDDLLWGLHELDRIDKHRLVLAITAKSHSWSATLDQQGRWYDFSFSGELKAGDIIGEIEGQHESDKQMSVTADIAFGEPEVFKGEALFPGLDLIANHVERIILEFGPSPL